MFREVEREYRDHDRRLYRRNRPVIHCPGPQLGTTEPETAQESRITVPLGWLWRARSSFGHQRLLPMSSETVGQNSCRPPSSTPYVE